MLFALIGIAMIVYGLWTVFFENRGYIKTDAVIMHIEEIFNGMDEDGTDDYSYIPTVAYKVDGKEYVNDLHFYVDGYEEGKTIQIFYNPSDPNDIHGSTKGMGIYLIGAGAFLILAAVYTILRYPN
jgi:hypothetical protein